MKIAGSQISVLKTKRKTLKLTGTVNLHVSLQAVNTREVSAAILTPVRGSLLPRRCLVPSGPRSTTGRGELEGSGGLRVRQEEVLLEVGDARVRIVAHRALERRRSGLAIVRLAVGV